MPTASSPPTSAPRRADWPFVLVALAFGALIGYAQLRLGELAISALLVAVVTMFLGALRPQRPWLWALLVALCVLAAQLFAYLGRERFTRGATFGSFALLAPAFVCAYGGAVGRRLVGELFKK
jgi:CDP-diglyceride synthetase